MAEHAWSVLCESAVIDKESNKASMFNVVEKLTASVQSPVLTSLRKDQPGMVPVRMDIISWWIRSDYSMPEKGAGRIRHLSPNGEELLSKEFPLDLAAGRTGWRTRLHFESYPVHHGPGLYWFEMQLKRATGWMTVARLPIELELIEVHPESQGAKTRSDKPKTKAIKGRKAKRTR